MLHRILHLPALRLADLLPVGEGMTPSAFGRTALPQRADKQAWELVQSLSDELNDLAVDEKKWDPREMTVDYVCLGKPTDSQKTTMPPPNKKP
jgi:hypothetical protein